MRDLLPREAWQRRTLARHVLTHFALHGYELVTPPAFELAEVLERGLGALDPADVLRFVEPESGEVAALRPDMTPQLARMVATRLSREPPPIRLCYEGTIVRRRQGRARRHRQVPQAGVELYGRAAPAGDVEILRLVASVIRAAGLERFVVDVGHASVARALVEPLPPGLSTEITEALVSKDTSRLDDLLRSPAASRLPARLAAAIAELPEMQGGGAADPGATALFARAERLLAGTPAETPLRELRALWNAARRPPAEGAGADLGDVLRIDLGEVRGFAYYTGVIFHVLAGGPGESIAAGGRYDDLLARFGAPLPAVGFALQLDAVAWAREAAGIVDSPPPRVLVALGQGSEELAAALRARGIAAVVYGNEEFVERGDLDDTDVDSYARAWRFTHRLARAHGGDGAAGDLELTILAGDAGASRRIPGDGAISALVDQILT